MNFLLSGFPSFLGACRILVVDFPFIPPGTLQPTIPKSDSLLDLAARTSNNLVRRLHDMAMPIPALPSTVSPLSPPTDAEVQDLKARIAQVWAVREGLKHALNQCVASPNRGLRELEAVDRQLAELDSRFKRMWDLQQNANKAQPKELA